MREEVQRIIKLVQEGKISAEDAADLIDAFAVSSNEPAEPAEAKNGHDAPPPPPPPRDVDPVRDPFKHFVESMEKLGKEASESVNWKEIAGQIREGTKKGVVAMRQGIEEVSKGKFNFYWPGTQETKEVSLPLAVPVGKTLRIENPCGDIKVVGGFDVGSVTANASFRGPSVEDAKAKAAAYTLIIEESDHVVLIKQPDVSGLSVDLEVQMAGSGSVEVRSDAGDITVLDTKSGCRINGRSGDVRLRGLNGVVEVSSSSGDLHVEDTVTPSLTIENKSGDITVKRVRGDMNVRTGSGNVQVKNSAGRIIRIEAASGDVSVDLSEPVAGNVDIRTVSGDSEVGLVDGSDCRVHLSTLRGSVECDLALDDAARAEQRITGRLGAGTGSVDVSAVNGDVTLRLRNAVAAD